MKKFFLLVSFNFLLNFVYSQTWLWGKQQGDFSVDNGRAICTDGSGCCYATGSVQNQARIFKYTNTGNLVWDGMTWMGDSRGIVSDNDGYLYVSGDSSNQIKLAKVDTAGNVIWKISDSLGLNTGIALDNAGYLYLTGSNDFITKYDTAGNEIWGRSVNAIANSIAIDPFGNLCVTGYFSGTAIFGTSTLIASGSEDIFVAKYDSSGICIWAKRAGGNHSFSGYSKDCGYGIAVDQIGNIYFTGSIVDTVNFDSINIFGLGSNDIFLAKYNSVGNVVWVKSAQGGSDEEGRCIAIDYQGSILIGGSYLPTVSFDGFPLTGWGNYDAYIAKYDSTGSFITVINAGEAVWNEFVYGISADNLGNIFATGSFYDVTQFGPDVPMSNGLFDMFTAKIDLTAGIESHSINPFNISAYPNPASTNITIEFEMQGGEEMELEIKNVLGQSIYFQKSFLSGKQKQEVDISSLSSGFYLLELRSGETFSSTKFIKQ